MSNALHRYNLSVRDNAGPMAPFLLGRDVPLIPANKKLAGRMQKLVGVVPQMLDMRCERLSWRYRFRFHNSGPAPATITVPLRAQCYLDFGPTYEGRMQMDLHQDVLEVVQPGQTLSVDREILVPEPWAQHGGDTHALVFDPNFPKYSNYPELRRVLMSVDAAGRPTLIGGPIRMNAIVVLPYPADLLPFAAEIGCMMSWTVTEHWDSEISVEEALASGMVL